MLETTQPQVDDSANQPDIVDGFEEGGNESAVQDENFMTIRYNKENLPLSKDAATTYAQKGMNYDKLSAKLEKANAKLSEYDEILKQGDDLDMNSAKQEIVDGQLGDFIQRNPGVDPRRLPKSVLNNWSKGVSLNEAFLSYQTGEYRVQANRMAREIEQRDINAKNAEASMGKPQSKGSAQQQELSDAVIKNMSSAELERNHKRIWTYLTGSK